jgi:ATP-dependent DNA helicase DinG
VLSAAFPSRLLGAFPPGTPIRRVTLDEALQRVGAGLHDPSGESLPREGAGAG